MSEPMSMQPPGRESVLSPVDRVSEMLFGLFMALTFVGAVSVADQGQAQIHTLFVAALGCNLAWGLVDAVMYLVRTVTLRGRSIMLVRSVRLAPDASVGARLIEQSVARDVAGLMTPVEIEAIRARMVSLTELPGRPELDKADLLAALGIFLIVVAATFPVVVPFIVFADVGVAKNVSRGIALVMLFSGGLALGRYAGFGSWKVGMIMTGLGSGLVLAINALGG